MINPKISIITPSYNQAQYIEQTIQSVINQNYPNLEYIIIDGGSTDNTLEIIKKYEKHVNYWISEPDTGQSNAINKGLKKAKGDIITWINSDDLLAPNALHMAQQYFMDYPAIMLIHGKTILFNDQNDKEILKGAEEEDLKYKYLAYMPFPQPSSFFRKQVVEKLGYLDESLDYGMDFDLLVRITLNYDILKVGNIFSKYRLHNTSKSISENIKFAHDWVRVFSKILRSFDFTEEFINALKILNLYHYCDDGYTVTKKYKKEDMGKAFLYFLKAQINNYYHNLYLDKAKQIALFVKKYNYDFYKSHNFNQINWRAKWLGEGMIKFLRRFTR
ncbi:MAG: glycosyltransferase [Cytophagales bacterium]|nr:glycosyltransferase [Cytophagales bacterium]